MINAYTVFILDMDNLQYGRRTFLIDNDLHFISGFLWSEKTFI